MSPTKTATVEDLVQQLSDVRQALQEERSRLLERVATIDQALGVQPAVASTKAAKAVRTPKTGIREAIGVVLAGAPNQTIKQLQEALPEHPPKSVESTVRAMSAEGKLSKDDGNPKKFSLPQKKSNGTSATA